MMAHFERVHGFLLGKGCSQRWQERLLVAEPVSRWTRDCPVDGSEFGEGFDLDFGDIFVEGWTTHARQRDGNYLNIILFSETKQQHMISKKETQ